MAFKVGPNLPSTVIQAGNQISVNALSALAAGDTPSSTNPFVTVSYFNSHGGGGGGGGASWGSISGTITNQTDLINKFNTYLLSSTADGLYYSKSDSDNRYLKLTGGGVYGQIVVNDAGSNFLYLQPTGIQFPDSTIQTSAATVFNGGTINNTIYITDGTNTFSIGAGGIQFANGTSQATAAYVLGSGNLDLDGYSITDGNFDAPAGQVTAQNVSMTDGGVLTFGDGSVQTTAATGGSSGLDAFGAFYAGICSTLYGLLQTWNYYYSPMQFVLQSSGSGQPFSGPSFALTSGNIGITSDGVNFYPIDQYQSYGSNNYIASSTYSGSPYGVYLAFKDGSGTWHQCPINFA